MPLSINFQSMGTWDSNATSAVLSPGDPAGVVVGDLLILVTGGRNNSLTLGALTGWTSLASRTTGGSIAMLGRIADGGANDTPLPDWDGSSEVFAGLQRFDGDMPLIGDLVAGSTTGGGTAGLLTIPLVPATAPSVTDALVLLVARKNKTSASNGVVLTPPVTEWTKRGQDAPTGGPENMVVVADWQQTGAGVNYDGDDVVTDISADALTANHLIVYLAPLASSSAAIAAHHINQMQGN